MCVDICDTQLETDPTLWCQEGVGWRCYFDGTRHDFGVVCRQECSCFIRDNWSDNWDWRQYDLSCKVTHRLESPELIIFSAGCHSSKSVLCQKKRSGYWNRYCFWWFRWRSDRFATWLFNRESWGGVVPSNSGLSDTGMCDPCHYLCQRKVRKNKPIQHRLVSTHTSPREISG